MKRRTKKQPTKDSDDTSAEWWEKRRADIKLELSKNPELRQSIQVFMGRPFAPGTFTLEAYHNDFPMPLAVIWYGFVGLNAIQINNIHTFEPVRRCGLMSLLQETMLRWFPKKSLVTGAGTPEGKAWMQANGWKKTEAGWERSCK